MLLLICNSKGGVCKTSLATSIVAELSKRGSVIGVDLDSVNKSASEEWSVSRSETEGRFYYLSGDISGEIESAKNDYDQVVVDAGGYDNAEFRRAVVLADTILIPLLVGSKSNIEGLRKVAEIIEQLRPENPPKVYGVATKAPNHGTSPELDRAIMEIVNDPLVNTVPTVIGDRVWYTRAFDESKGITEVEPIKRGEADYIKKAKDEFMKLFNHIYGEQNV